MYSVKFNCRVPEAFFQQADRERVALVVGRKAGPRFSCGYGELWVIDRILPVPNALASEGEHVFAITRHWVNLIGGLVAPKTVIGAVHSHLNQSDVSPSENDLHGIPHSWIGMVYHVPTRQITVYWGEDKDHQWRTKSKSNAPYVAGAMSTKSHSRSIR